MTVGIVEGLGVGIVDGSGVGTKLGLGVGPKVGVNRGCGVIEQVKVDQVPDVSILYDSCWQ